MSIMVQLDAVIPPELDVVNINSTDWQVSTTNAFNPTDIVFDQPNDTVDKIRKYVILQGTGPFWGRSRINTDIGTTDWSDPVICQDDISPPQLTVTG